MPSAKSGSSISIVAPEDPEAALDADEADPGKVAEIKQQQVISKEGKYSATPVALAAASSSSTETEQDEQQEEKEDEATHFISFELKYEDGTPVPDEPYKVKLSDGSVKSGKTDKDGKVLIEGVPNGKCEVNYPRIDKDQWRKA